MLDEEYLDNELKNIEQNVEEGLVKINEARKLLPTHYKDLMSDIGGDIDTDFDLNRLPSNLRKMVEIFEVEAPALGTQTNVMVATMAYASLFGKFRPYIRDILVSKKADIPANVFAISLVGSGEGKDKSFDLGLDILKKANTLILDKMVLDSEIKAKRIAIAKNREKQEKEGVPKDKIVDDDSGWNKYYNQPHDSIFKMATYEGLLAAAEETTKNGELGNIFVAISELGNSLKLDPNIDRLMMVLAELYDVGKAPEDLKKTKELKTGAIEGLAPSMLAHTSPAPLLSDSKLVAKLKTMIGSYFGRRAYILYTSLSETVENVELNTDLENQVKMMMQSTFKSVEDIEVVESNAVEAVTRLLSGTDLHMLSLTDDARMLYGKYFLLNKYYRRLSYMKDQDFSGEGLLTELTNRHWRAIKVAGIWALAQNSSVITKDLMSSAIYFTEYLGKGLRKLMDMIDLEVHERFIRALENKDIGSTYRFDQLIKQNYVKKADKNQISALLTAVNSALQGKAVVIADYKKSILNIDIIKESEGEYGFSYIKFPKGLDKDKRKEIAYKGFKYYKKDLSYLKNILANDCAYLPFKLKDGYRKDDNVISTTNYVVLDVDKSDIDMDVLHETYLSGTLHMIATTSDNTNKRKFRIIIPIQQQLGENNQIYKYVIQRIADELMLDIDLLGRSQVMYGYSDSIVLDNINSNLQPMDVGNYIKDAASNIQVNTHSKQLTKAEQKKLQANMEHDFETVFSRAIYAPNGQGSISLFLAGRDMQQAGCTFKEIEIYLNKINSMWTSPMPHSRLNKIINQFKVV